MSRITLLEKKSYLPSPPLYSCKQNVITPSLLKACSKSKGTNRGMGRGSGDRDSLPAFTTLQRAIIDLKGSLDIHREFLKPNKIHLQRVYIYIYMINGLLCFLNLCTNLLDLPNIYLMF